MPFRDVIGHRRLVGLLTRAVQLDTLPPSLLFTGPAGVGKRLVATATAQALNCRAGVGATGAAPDLAAAPGTNAHNSLNADSVGKDACGVCPACTRIARGVHPDVILVEPGDTGSIKIDQVRDIVDRAAYRPFEGARRVVIVDQADALMPPAQNALLKTLEEPPSASVFLLITPRPDALLPTVRSRCPRLAFRPLSMEEVAAALVRRGRSEAEARAVAATADGSIGRALEASATELVDAREVAQRVLARAAASDDPRRRLEGSRDLLEKTGAGGARDREQLAAHLRAMASLVRDVELLSSAVQGVALANADVRPAVERLSVYRGDRGIRAFTAIDQGLAALERNAGVKVVADWVMLQL